MRGQGDPPRGCAELRIDAFFIPPPRKMQKQLAEIFVIPHIPREKRYHSTKGRGREWRLDNSF